MAASAAVHVLFFALVILSQVLSKLNKPTFQSFQVDLITTGSGQSSPSRLTQKKARSASKKPSASPGKTSRSIKPQKKAATTAPVKTRVSSPKAAPQKKSPAAPPKPATKAPVAVQDDPERLEEWWKKQSKSMKVAKSTTAKKQNKIVTPKRRTAKIDIERKSIVVPPVTTN